MPLEVDHGRRCGPSVAAAEEVVVADFVQRRGRGERRDVAAERAVGLLVGPDHHRHGVPADDALDPAFDLEIAGIPRLLFEAGIVLIYGVVAVKGIMTPRR